ncbi:MAG: hypothetical protein ACR2OO_08995, partial [Thermomicrobiales bacterium]
FGRQERGDDGPETVGQQGFGHGSPPVAPRPADGMPGFDRRSKDGVGLAPSLARGVPFSALPASAAPPALTAQKVTAVVDGSSIQTEGGVLRLAGVDAPAPAECFGGKSIAKIKKLAGKRVLVERDPADPGAAFIWTQPGKGPRESINHALVADGYAAASGSGGASGAWLGDAGAAAKTSLVGLCAACTNQHGVAREQGPESTGLALTSTGAERPYAPWIAWSPWVVTTPDGGAWAFFSADATEGTDTGKKRLYSSRFDPATGKWTPAAAMAGGEIQMGPTAVVDAKGMVHLVFTDRAKDQDGIYTVLMYTHEDGAGGWVTPVPVAPDPQAGFQLSPSLAIDKGGTLHVAWQDQRGFAADARISSPANADIYTSELPPGGAWTPPAIVNTHFNDAVSSRPHIVADGDRLIAVWSVYAASLGLDFAARIDWNSRPLDNPNGWGTSQGLIVGRGEKFGGRLLDPAADPTGGAVLVFGRQANDTFLFLRRLDAGSSTWGGDVLVTYGDRGTFPSLAMAADGTAYVAYNVGSGSIVKVGAVSVSFHSIQPGPEVNLTEKEKGAQGRPIITVDDTGHPWVVFFVDPGTGVANGLQVLRNADIPTASPAT